MADLLGSPMTILTVVAGALLAAGGLLGTALVLQLRELRARDAERLTALERLRGELLRQQDETARLARRHLELQHQLDQLRGRQDRLELDGPQTQPYAQAAALARRGADASELAATFGLSPGEAELLLRMHARREAG